MAAKFCEITFVGLLVTLVIFVTTCCSKPYEEDGLMKAMKHFSLMSQYSCSKPSPRIFKVQDFHDEPDKKFLPEHVLLHRCESSGCCNNSMVCAPIDQETVKMYFLIDTATKSRRNKAQVAIREFTNHTKCGCKDLADVLNDV